jgi:hypothetical protein
VPVEGGRQPVEHVLFLAVTSSGGDVTTEHGLFKHNDRVGLVGTVQASYLLIDRAGLVKAGGSRAAFSAPKFHIGDNRIDWEPDQRA